MLIREIKALLDAQILSGEQMLDHEVGEAFASDMMSDVLAFANPHCVLLTGLCNPQVIRTAEMLDVSCIVFVRGKPLDSEIKGKGDVRPAHRERNVYNLRHSV